MLKKFDMDKAKPIKTPMPTNGHLDLNEEGKSVDQKVYRSMIGSLLYLCASRPDIMLSVCMCARFQANPKECHLMAVKRILRYQCIPLTLACGIIRAPNEDIPSIHSTPNTLDIAGPITRSRPKQLEKEIHSQVNANLMINNHITLNEPMLLSTCFNVLRNDGVHEQAWDEDEFKRLDI
jgi:hypothetical protein